MPFQVTFARHISNLPLSTYPPRQIARGQGIFTDNAGTQAEVSSQKECLSTKAYW